MVYGFILITYLLNVCIVINFIFQTRIRIPNFYYTLLLMIALPFLTPFIYFFLMIDQKIHPYSPKTEPLELRGNGELFDNGDTFMSDLITEIEAAKHYILINMFIFNTDRIGQRIIRKLEEKQEEGVQVIVVYDYGAKKKLKRSNFKSLKKLGGRVICFMPLLMNRRLNLNYRNHRKMILIDHRIAYLGGFNIGDEYLGRDPKMGRWMDIELKITGNVKPLYFIVEQDLKRIKRSLPNEIHRLPVRDTSEPTNTFKIITSGLEKHVNTSLMTFIHLIFQAKKEIQIMTPYLIMNDGFIDALLYQANQGCKISILMPSKNDHPFVNNASRAMAKKLLHPNIYIHLYSPQGFMHAKVLLIDDEQLFVTSANIDNRSFYYNLELGAITRDQSLIQWMAEEFMIQKKQSKLFTKEDVRFIDKIALLFASFL